MRRFEPQHALADTNDPHTYRTAVGAFRRIPLDDGSTVELNTNTVVHIELTKHKREIWLLQGEANFDVEKSATRPFIVHAGRTTVRALGTSFGVRMYDEVRAGVLVTKGQVAVSNAPPSSGFLGIGRASPTSEAVVSAGEHAINSAGRVTIYAVPREEMLNRQAWRHGSIVFADRPLREVVAELNRYNEAQLRIVDPAIEDIRFSGQLALRGTDRFLAVLAKAHGILGREVVGDQDVIELRGSDEP
jgi:transmembrane sensor